MYEVEICKEGRRQGSALARAACRVRSRDRPNPAVQCAWSEEVGGVTTLGRPATMVSEVHSSEHQGR